MKLELRIFSCLCLVLLISFKADGQYDLIGWKKSDGHQLTILNSGKTFDKMKNVDYDIKAAKQDYFTSPTGPDFPVKTTTLHVVHTTIRVLGVFATFIVFILIPIIELIVSAIVGSPILLSRQSKKFNFNSNSNYYHSNSEFNSMVRQAKTLWPFSEMNEEEARGILDTSRCIERISCYANGAYTARSFIQNFVFGQTASGKQLTPDPCAQYTCYPVSFIIRLFIYLIDWNTLLKV